MVATARIRVRNGGNIVGTIGNYDSNGVLTSTDTYDSGIRFSDACEDVVGNFNGGNGLIVDHSKKSYGTLNGVAYYTLGRRVRNRITGVCCAGDNFPTHLSVSVPTFSGALMASIMNPSRPIVDLPVFLFELKDLPGMLAETKTFASSMRSLPSVLRAAGNSIIRNQYGKRAVIGRAATNMANANLSYSFGWEPLFGDMSKMLSFMAAVDKRKSQIHKIFSPKGLRRRMGLPGGSAHSFQRNLRVNSGAFTLDVDTTTTTTVRRWGTQRYTANDAPPGSDAEAQSLAIRATLGLNIDRATLWNMLPWSWLVDWFTKFGTYLDANRNTIPCTGGPVWLCVHTKTQTIRSNPNYHIVIYSGGPSCVYSGGLGSASRETKYRTQASVTPFPASLPFLGAKPVSILASLTVAKRKSWHVN